MICLLVILVGTDRRQLKNLVGIGKVNSLNKDSVKWEKFFFYCLGSPKEMPPQVGMLRVQLGMLHV